MIFSCMLFGMIVVFFSSCLVFNIVVRSGYIVSVVVVIVSRSIMVSENSVYSNASVIVESISIFPFVCVSIFMFCEYLRCYVSLCLSVSGFKFLRGCECLFCVFIEYYK